MNDKIAVGRVSTAHGVHGDLRILSLSGEKDHLLKLDHVFLVQGEKEMLFRVEKIRPHGSKVLLAKLKGIDSPEEAKKLTGYMVYTERGNACPLSEGEYYQADLLGCEVFYGDEPVGTVSATIENGPKDLIEVTTVNGRRLIPFEDEYIGEVRVDEKKIELKLDWLL